MEDWKFDPILALAGVFVKSGPAIETAGVGVARRCEQLPALKAWDGVGHTAANEAFGRAKDNAVAIGVLAEGMSTALTEGYWSLSSAKQTLMGKVAEIEGGSLLVHDKWAVIVKPIHMSQDEARELIKERDRLQAELNPLVSAMGAADDSTATAVTAAAEAQGYVPIGVGVPGQLSGLNPPQGDILDPTTPLGYLVQRGIAEADAAMTVASKVPGVNEKGEETVTVFMQDGSRRVITESSTYAGSYYKRPMMMEEAFDPSGELVSTTKEFELDSGNRMTIVTYADRTRIQTIAGPHGSSVEIFPQGKEPIEIAESEFFSHPVLTSAGGVISGVETYGGKQLAAELPAMTMETAEELRSGAKYGGLALAVGVAAYDVIIAEDASARCRATIAGVASVAGGYGGGALGAMMGGNPFAAAGLAAGGSWAFGYLGSELGEAVCY